LGVGALFEVHTADVAKCLCLTKVVPNLLLDGQRLPAVVNGWRIVGLPPVSEANVGQDRAFELLIVDALRIPQNT
jgi:hypothetical protein